MKHWINHVVGVAVGFLFGCVVMSFGQAPKTIYRNDDLASLHRAVGFSCGYVAGYDKAAKTLIDGYKSANLSDDCVNIRKEAIDDGFTVADPVDCVLPDVACVKTMNTTETKQEDK